MRKPVIREIGYTTRELSQTTGISPKAVCAWFRRHGIRPAAKTIPGAYVFAPDDGVRLIRYALDRPRIRCRRFAFGDLRICPPRQHEK